MSEDPSEEQILEDVVFECLEADDPRAELLRRSEQWSVERRARANRALEGVLEQERELTGPSFRRPPPAEIDGYRIVRELATGGMGTVYLAEQRVPVRRRVALKVIRGGMATEQVLRRFELERQALALMDHDNIAKIFEARTTAAGDPYFVMEYVPGQPIIEYCDKNRLGTRARLRLFEQVCSAVQHAHHRGIIHRDLKPTNILIADHSERPIPKIIDFGLARPTHGRLLDVTVHTQLDAFVGTPAYMSPEQAEMSAAEVDTRTDIYSLGVVLYELLTGTLPFSAESLRGPAAEVQRVISEGNVPLPSSRASSNDASSTAAAARRSSSPRALTKSLRGDLDWIVMKAVERDRGRRYPTASELGADIRRYLADEPVLAGPPDLSYRVRKFVRKHRAKVTAAAAVAGALLIGAIASTLLWLDARDSAELAREQEQLAADAAAEAEESLRRFHLLRHRIELDDAVTLAGELFPAWPEQLPALREWVDHYATPLAHARPEVAAAAAELGVPRDGEDATTRFLRDTLHRLSRDLEQFFAPERGLAADVAQRLRWAESVASRGIDAHRERWEQVRVSILRGDAGAYRSDPPLEIDPQLGLVPIGINPVTGLWEFHHLRSAADPDRLPRFRADGRIEVTEASGIVFVLVPGGRFTMGVQAEDPDGPNYDPHADAVEGPPRQIAVSPYFLARHELTQAQYERLARNELPSAYLPGRKVANTDSVVDRRHPVENLSFVAAAELMRRHGLRLPTEREWAFACRMGGEDPGTPWSSGAEPASLAGRANVLDRTAVTHYPGWGEAESFDDGYVAHAPVGTFRPNRFGLHDLHGNVWEWCEPHPRDPRRTARGGGFSGAARFARTAIRWQHDPEYRSPMIGLRPARAIDGQPGPKDAR